MKSRMVSIVAVIPVLLLVISGFVAGRTVGQGGPVTIHVVERPASDAVTDLGEEGDTMGDLLTFANLVFDENNEVQIGTDQGYCVRTVPGEAWECFWTLFLEDGQITVEGPFYDAGPSTLAVTGGTGVYVNAGGQMTLQMHEGEEPAYDFIYELYLNDMSG